MERRALVFLLIVLFFLSFVPAGQAKPFYQGKVIRIIEAEKPGGGYDWYARLIAKYMQKYLPGSTIIVKNVPGAGHIIGTNEMYVSKPDGLTVGIFNRAVGLAQVVGLKGVKFDFGKMSWLGSPCSEHYAYIVDSKKFKNLDEVFRAKNIRLATTGLGTMSYVCPLLLYQAKGLDNFSLATGYSGAEMELALMRNECDGLWGSVASRRAILSSGEGRAVLVIGRNKPKGLEDAPLIEEVLTEPQHKRVVNLLRGLQLVGRPFAGPPGIPQDRLKILREAFEKACKDPEALAFAKKSKRPMDFVDYKEVEDWAGGMMELPPPLVAKLKEAYGVK